MMMVREPAGYMTGMADFCADTIPAYLIKTNHSNTLIACRATVANNKWSFCL
jgi:hypothetical protein